MAAPPPFKKLKTASDTRPTSSSGSSAIMTEDVEVTHIDHDDVRLIRSNTNESPLTISDIPSYDLSIYYDGSALAVEHGPSRALRILLVKPHSENDVVPLATLTSGWTASTMSVNLFLEAGLYLPGLDRQCHLQFEVPANVLKAGDIRSSLAVYFDADISDIQLEFLPIESQAHTEMLNPSSGTCRRTTSVWNDTCFDDRSTLEEIVSKASAGPPDVSVAVIEGKYECFRVARVESISLNMSDDHFACSFTPDHTATVGDLRGLAAALRLTQTGAVHLQFDDRELEEDDYPLQAEGLTPGSEVSCWLELVDCTVCGEDEIPFAEFEQPITAQCLHKRQTCSECIRTWIATKLENGLWDTIGCPGNECKEVLQYIDMKRFASDDHFERYVSYLLRTRVES
jgi:hypothetical protein